MLSLHFSNTYLIKMYPPKERQFSEVSQTTNIAKQLVKNESFPTNSLVTEQDFNYHDYIMMIAESYLDGF